MTQTGAMTDNDVLAGLWMLVRLVVFATLSASVIFVAWTLSGILVEALWQRVAWTVGMLAMWVSLID